MIAEQDNDRPDEEPFEDERPAWREAAADRLLLDIDGYEGPIDILLTLARDQKVDLARISILALADQYLEFIARARDLRLEIAADYLVMAAWLAYLKSRLLLPDLAQEDEPSGAEMAALLAFQLQRLEAMKEAGARLMERPRLGRDFCARGAPEPLEIATRPVFDVTLYDILRAYADQHGRRQASTLYIAPTELYAIEEAIRRLRGVLGDIPDWTVLSKFLPENFTEGLLSRSAIASTFVASLELARSGRIELRQAGAYAPIYIRAAKAGK